MFPEVVVSRKKILENPIVGSLMVPIAVVLVGIIIIYGFTKLLSTERNHRDLVREMQTRTFGNRWVAALELSKLLNHSQIPVAEVPWLAQNLGELYQDSAADERTRNFIILALGSLQHVSTLPILQKALQDADPQVHFNAIYALGNMPEGVPFDWKNLLGSLHADDAGLVEVAILALAQHRVDWAEKEIVTLLKSPVRRVRYASAVALVTYKNIEALPVLKEVLRLQKTSEEKEDNAAISFNEQQIYQYKMNVLNAIAKSQWSALHAEIEQLIQLEKNEKVLTRAKEILHSVNRESGAN